MSRWLIAISSSGRRQNILSCMLHSKIFLANSNYSSKEVDPFGICILTIKKYPSIIYRKGTIQIKRWYEYFGNVVFILTYYFSALLSRGMPVSRLFVCELFGKTTLIAVIPCKYNVFEFFLELDGYTHKNTKHTVRNGLRSLVRKLWKVQIVSKYNDFWTTIYSFVVFLLPQMILYHHFCKVQDFSLNNSNIKIYFINSTKISILYGFV